MPNIKSAKKRVKVIETKTLQNKMFRTQLKTAMKKYEAAVNAGDAALALFFDIAAVSAVILGINRHSVRIHKVRKFLIAVAVLP